MKNKVFYFLIFLLVIAALLVVFNDEIMNKTELDEKALDTKISLSHNMEMEFPADSAQLYLAVESRNNNLEDAKNENNKKITSIMEQLAKYENIKITTSNFTVNTFYKNDDKNTVDYYQLRNLLEIKINDLDILSNLINESLNSGANKIYRLEYLLNDKENAKKEVIEKAIAELEDKINIIKDSLEKENYHLINLNVNDNIQLRNIYYDNLKSNSLESENSSLNINPGNITISVNLRGEYQLY